MSGEENFVIPSHNPGSFSIGFVLARYDAETDYVKVSCTDCDKHLVTYMGWDGVFLAKADAEKHMKDVHPEH